MNNYLHSNLNHIHFVFSNLHEDSSVIKVSKNIVKIRKSSRNFITKASNRLNFKKSGLIKKNILKKMYYLSSF